MIVPATQAAAAQPAASEPNFMLWVAGSVIIVVIAAIAMRWAGKTVKKDLDPAMAGRMRASMAIQADSLTPAMVKEALQKGLVTSQQLATMSPIERQFLFKQLTTKLSGDAPPAPALSASAPVLPLKPSVPAAPANAAQLRSTQAIVAIPGKGLNLPPLTPEQLAALGPPPGVTTSPRRVTPQGGTAFGDDGFQTDLSRMHCPLCGSRLNMPSAPPFSAFCDQCGAKTAVRTEDQGRLIINTAPPGVTRRPVK